MKMVAHHLDDRRNLSNIQLVQINEMSRYLDMTFEQRDLTQPRRMSTSFRREEKSLQL